MASISLTQVRKEFPCLEKVGGRSPVYLDNPCMTLKPKTVIQAMDEYYNSHPSCHKRSLHAFGRITTEKFTAARNSVKAHFNVGESGEIVFTRNTTEAINLVAHSLRLHRGDVVLTSDFEHNSNLLPWQFSAQRNGVIHKRFTIAPDNAALDLREYEALLKEGRVKLVSVFHSSHVTGISLPIREMAELAHKHGALFLLDAAQGVAHHAIDVRELAVDFMAFSFHKAFGPTGMGALYGTLSALERLDPYLVGGETVQDADYETCTLAPVPERFEAGLQNYAGVIGGARALEFLGDLGIRTVERHVAGLNQLFTEKISRLERVKVIGPKEASARGSVCNFVVEGIDSAELSIVLDKSYGIMTRSGVHCCHSWYRKNKLRPSLRVGFSIYNNEEEVLALADALGKISKYF